MSDTTARWAIAALCMYLGCAGASIRPGYRSDGLALDADEVRAEISMVQRAMLEVYAGRGLMTPESWKLLTQSLLAIPPDEQTSDTLCVALADALRTAWSVRVFDRRGSECILRGAPKREPFGGDNLASKAAAIEMREWRDPAITAISVRKLDASASVPEGTVASIERAEAIIVDLRNARGDDPRPLLPLLEAIVGKSSPPLEAIDVPSTPFAAKVRATIPRDRIRNPSAWAGFVGTSPADSIPHRRNAKPLFVLLGGRCDGPCQLAARLFQTRANGYVVGTPMAGEGLFLTDEGEVELGRSAIHIRVPTALYRPSASLGSFFSPGGSWAGLVVPPLTGFHDRSDLLDQALAVSRAELGRRGRRARFESDPPPSCASFSTSPSPGSLPEGARRRLAGGVFPPRPRIIRAYVTLTAKSARKFIAGCPGLAVHDIQEGPSLTTVWLEDADFSDIARLLQSETVELIEAGPLPQVYPN